ncbi:DUF3047 domain-containing protein [Granulosicoccaceae sp. 1_MG-2023]|nr:DUF3047 domain-containing protein [Granulosicoccaceae sp. 1_MG-2023]
MPTRLKTPAFMALLLGSGFLCLCTGTAADTTLAPFSGLAALDEQSGWEPLTFPGIKQHSRYQLENDDGVQVIRADTSGGASGLIARVSTQPGESLILRWRWKVSNVFEQGDARSKSGDDYPARIYVAFVFQPEKAGWLERTKRKAAALIFGEELPGNALNYIWANKLPAGTMIPNPYTDQTRMVAVNSGMERAGRWVSVERDIVADYREAFGEEPPALAGIAIMSDSDNTGETATAWYGDISLTTDP